MKNPQLNRLSLDSSEYIDISDMVEEISDQEWEDEPTLVTDRSTNPGENTSVILPPPENSLDDPTQEVYLLTHKRNNVVSLDDLLNKPQSTDLPDLAPPPVPTLPPESRTNMESLAPISMSSDAFDDDDPETTQAPEKTPNVQQRRSLVTVMAPGVAMLLAAAAVALIVFPNRSNKATAPSQAHVASRQVVHQSEHSDSAKPRPVHATVSLEPVSIEAMARIPKPSTVLSQTKGTPSIGNSGRPLSTREVAAALETPIDDLPELRTGAKIAPATTTPENTTETETPTAPEAPPVTEPFNRAAASTALAQGAAAAKACPHPDANGAVAHVSISFAPTGRVTTAVVSGPHFSGTPLGSCVARAFRKVQIPPYVGPFVTVHKNVHF